MIISLDFELLWGVFDVINYKEKSAYFKSTIQSIPEILKLFKKYEIHCTWATVGMLFLRDWEEWKKQQPLHLPTYLNNNLSSYNFIESQNETIPPEFCFAPELIKLISNFPHQEIGTHTYSHFYCNEEGQTILQFENDLRKAVESAQKMGIILKSLVFPRNQINPGYLEICNKYGITSVRSNPNVWYWNDPQSNSFIVKLFRTGDAYNNFNQGKSYPLKDLIVSEKHPLVQKASRFLRPFEKNSRMHRLKMKRIKTEMINAAKKNEVYHLWWHPHNFGDNPNESIEDLREILEVYKFCNKKYKFNSLTMDELYLTTSVKNQLL